MLGLLRKDLSQLKSYILIPIALITFMGVAGVFTQTVIVFRANVVIFYAILFAPNVITYEAQGKTIGILRALPLHPRTIVGAKFVWLLVFVGAPLGLLWLFQFVSMPSAAWQTVLNLSWTTFAAISLGSVLLLIQFAVRGSRAKWYVAAGMGLALFFSTTVDLSLRFDVENPDTFFNTALGYIVATAAGLVVATCAWMWASRIFARRDVTEL